MAAPLRTAVVRKLLLQLHGAVRTGGASPVMTGEAGVAAVGAWPRTRTDRGRRAGLRAAVPTVPRGDQESGRRHTGSAPQTAHTSLAEQLPRPQRDAPAPPPSQARTAPRSPNPSKGRPCEASTGQPRCQSPAPGKTPPAFRRQLSLAGRHPPGRPHHPVQGPPLERAEPHRGNRTRSARPLCQIPANLPRNADQAPRPDAPIARIGETTEREPRGEGRPLAPTPRASPPG
jgi:hypothetical protein